MSNVKVRVPILGTVGKSISLNPNATDGATIGTNLHLSDGSTPTIEQLRLILTPTSDSQTPGLANTIWRLVGEIPSDPLSVLGNPTNATLKPIAVIASADKAVLHRDGNALAFTPIDHTYISDFYEAAQDAVGGILVDSATIGFTYSDATPSITAIVIDDSITNAKLRNSAATSIIGRSANTVGDPADIIAGTDDTILRQTASALSFGQLTVGMFPDDVVTYAKIQNVSASSRVLGRISSGAGDIEELTAANLATIIGGTTILFADGTVGAPSISFASDTDTGRYRIGANNMGDAVGGALVVDYSAVRIAFQIPVALNGYTVATLPAGAVGYTAYVTDALAPVFLGAVAGGGAITCTVFHNGTNWVVQ